MADPSVNIVKKVWGIISTVIVIAAVVLAVLLVGTRIIGLRPLTVLSGSMEPDIKTGSLIYVKKVDPATLKVGDDITYTISEDTYATHRIIQVIPEGHTLDANGEVKPIDTSNANANPNSVKIKLRFQTKGTNNDLPDATPVADVNIVGKVQFSIPYLGYVSDYIQNPPGTYIAISVGAILILLVFLPDLLFDDKSAQEKDTKKKKKKDDEEQPDNETADNETEVEVKETAEITEDAVPADAECRTEDADSDAEEKQG